MSNFEDKSLFDEFPDYYEILKQPEQTALIRKKKEMEFSAIFSDDRNYRYVLNRSWDKSKPFDVWIMLNPSIADHERNDPTISRCINFSKDNGAGGIIVINLFARIETISKLLPHMQAGGIDIIGVDNYDYFDEYCIDSHRIICAWGNIPAGLKRPKYKALNRIKNELLCLGLNKTGNPCHPLYMPRITKFRKFELL